MYEVYVSPFELYHYDILGQKWGVRRFQNPDGSLTEEGRLRYSKGKSVYNYESKATKKYATKFGTDSKVYERSAELDKKLESRYLNNAPDDAKSLAKDVAKFIVMGGITGMHTYELSRATGRGRVNSFVRSWADMSLDRALASLVGGAAGFGVEVVGAAAGLEEAAANVVGSVAGTVARTGKELEYRGAGKERSLQQHWLRKNYAQKGSAQEQKAAKEVARAEKKNAAQEQKAAKEAARAEKKDAARRDAIVKDLYKNPNYNKAIDLARLENADENGHIENEDALVKSFYKHLKELDPKAYEQSQELDKKYDMVWR